MTAVHSCYIYVDFEACPFFFFFFQFVCLLLSDDGLSDDLNFLYATVICAV